MASVMQQRGRDNRAAADEHAQSPAAATPDAGGEGVTTIHHAGPGGTGPHTVQHHDGEQSGPHEHLHEAMAHIAAHSGDGGRHHFTHDDGMGGAMKTHQTAHGSEPEGHDHENLESVKNGMDQFFNEEEHEGHEGGEGGERAGEDEY